VTPRASNQSTPKKPPPPLLASNLSQLPWLVHGFSTRHGGVSRTSGKSDLNLGHTTDDRRANVDKNRAIFLKSLACAKVPLITLRQVHSDLIWRVDGPQKEQLAGDGLVTETPGLLLAIQTADCLPIVLVDRKRRAVGVFHAGWRGTVQRIAEKGVGAMRLHFGSRPGDLVAAIGPGIHGCCYEVGEEVRTRFESQFDYAAELFRESAESDPVREKYPMLFLTARAPGHSYGLLPKKIFLDLVEANRRQLIAAGVRAKNIEATPLCTNCHPELLFSYRAEKAKTGRMMAAAGIRD
jgi:polyphenol oxidase